MSWIAPCQGTTCGNSFVLALQGYTIYYSVGFSASTSTTNGFGATSFSVVNVPISALINRLNVTVAANNIIGSSSQVQLLTTLSAPVSAPTNIAITQFSGVTVSSFNVVLNWTAPCSGAYCASDTAYVPSITGYRVQFQSPSGFTTVTAWASTNVADLDVLVSNIPLQDPLVTAYTTSVTFFIAAVNYAGIGPSATFVASLSPPILPPTYVGLLRSLIVLAFIVVFLCNTEILLSKRFPLLRSQPLALLC